MGQESEVEDTMTNEEYIKLVLETESIDISAIQERLGDPQVVRLVHAAMGMVTEAGELLDMLKKHLFYGRELDLVNVEEELGDSLWYLGLAVDDMREMGYDTSIEQIQEKNIAKLRKRYGEKFSKDAALTRDLDAERKILEDGPQD